MEKMTIKGFIQCEPASNWDNNTFEGFTFSFWTYKDMTSHGYSLVCPIELTFEIPEGFDPRGEVVKRLEEQKRKVQAEFQAKITEIERQISQFTAIEFAG